MAKEELEVEEGNEEGNATESNTEVVNDDANLSREDLVANTFAEGIDDAVIENLSGKENITLDDLRQLPGAEGLSDAQLTTAWARAMKDAGLENGLEGDKKVELPFPVYDAQGNKIDSDKVTLGDLLSGKALVGYNAMGKEQRKALNEVIRNASQGHWNEHRYNTVNSQYRQEHQRASELQKQVTQFTEQQSQWNSALTAMVMGDAAPMKALVDAYRGALGKTNFTPEGFVPQDTVAAEREASERGMQWYQDVGMPAAIDIATNYGADPKEVIGAIKYFIEAEPVLTPQRIDEILKYDVPMAFEANGYSPKGSGTGITNKNGNGNEANNGASNEVETLKNQVAALTQRLAGNTNDRTNAVRDKSKRTPPAGSGATSGAGDSMPAFKSRDAMKEWLRS